MTGTDIAWWLEDLWYDLLHLGSADVPLLVFKLFVLFVVLFFGWQLGRMVVKAVWSVLERVLRFAWMIVSAPVRLPWRGLKRLSRPVVRRRQQRRWQREQAAEAERARMREQEEARKQAAALAAAGKVLDVD
jgi:Zn-dependent protease with chaperone function